MNTWNYLHLYLFPRVATQPKNWYRVGEREIQKLETLNIAVLFLLGLLDYFCCCCFNSRSGEIVFIPWYISPNNNWDWCINDDERMKKETSIPPWVFLNKKILLVMHGIYFIQNSSFISHHKVVLPLGEIRLSQIRKKTLLELRFYELNWNRDIFL